MNPAVEENSNMNCDRITRSKRTVNAPNPTQIGKSISVNCDTDQQLIPYLSNSKTNVRAIAFQQFSVNEVIWGKQRGYPHWPGKIVKILQNKYEIFWFNDYRKSNMFPSQLFKFKPKLVEFSKKESEIGNSYKRSNSIY